MEDQDKIAVLIPCHNEEQTIGKVVDDFRAHLPSAVIYVFNNCCTDRTAEIAAGRGAVVLAEPRKGKGFVIESMLSRVQADYYVMVDGDDTYSAMHVTQLLEPVMSGKADMAVGARLADFGDKSFRPLHVAGNNLVRGLINMVFGSKLTDIMSGYRAFNRKVIRCIPVVSAGFEVETEMTIQMLYYKLAVVEVQVPYRQRPEGSASKLRTFRDGFRVLWKIFSLFRAIKPLTFFGLAGLVLFALGVLAGIPPIRDYVAFGYVYHVPLAVLATGLMLLSAGCVFLGVLLHAINWRFKELHNVLTRGDKQ
ncbi:MAG: glycosyltransferase [Planctomycetes bacterium]|nr:glycosyltransferase [Planctomycetota bacterium]